MTSLLWVPPVHAWQEPGCLSLAPSDTTQPTLDFLLSRIQALEDKFHFPRSAAAQQFSAYGQHVPCALGAQSFLLSPPTFNRSPYAIAGLDPTLTQAPYDLQHESTTGRGYSPPIIAPLHLNNAVDTSGSGFSPVVIGDPDNLHFNPDTDTADNRDKLSASTQDWDALPMINIEYDNGNFPAPMVDLAAAATGTQANVDQSVTAGPASQRTGNSDSNSCSELESFDDITNRAGAYSPSGIDAAVGDNIRGATQADVRILGNVIAPNNMTSPSSPTGRAGNSRARTHRCNVSMQCQKAFARRADRDRHALTHNSASARTYSCPSNGCDRIGVNGFWRLDKYKEHRAKLGH